MLFYKTLFKKCTGEAKHLKRFNIVQTQEHMNVTQIKKSLTTTFLI